MKLFALLCLINLFPVNGWTQTYPGKVVRYVIPFAAGGSADVLGRIVTLELARVFGQPVVVDNRAGAASNIGAEVAAKAAPDGYTLFQVNIAHAANVTLYGNKLSYDLVRDFAPVTQLATAPAIVVAHPSLPVKSLGDLVRLAKSKPGAINYSSAGTGTSTFLAAELFKAQAGVNLMHVPYKSGAMAATGILSGETSIYFAPLPVATPHIRDGRLRGLAVTSAKRVPTLANYPTIAEVGYAGYAFGSWNGLMVPAKTPTETIAAIRTAAVKVLNDPNVRTRLIDLGYIAIGDQPEEFAAHIKAEIASLGKILRQSSVTAE